METVDLYQTHRWGLRDAHRADAGGARRRRPPGKVRYIGTSSQWARQFAEALHTSDLLGYERFVTMQNHYNLVYREEEREMLPLCEREDRRDAVVAARPRLPHPPPRGRRGHQTRRHRRLPPRAIVPGGWRSGGQRARRGTRRGEGRGDGSDLLAWLFHKEWVDAPIVGTTSVEHLEDAVEALDIDLSDADVDYLEEPYQPVQISGHE